MKSLLRYMVEHRTAANLLMAVVVLSGLAAAFQIRTQFFPDIVVERLTVRVPWDGASARDVDQGIVAALEPRLQTIEGVDRIESLSREGVARITLEFEPGADLSAAADDAKAAIDLVDALPDDAEEARVQRGRYRDRVTNIVLAGPTDLFTLDRYARELRRQLFKEGVTRVTIRGTPEPEIRIKPREADLERYGLTLRRISDAVAAEVASRPAGELTGAGARVRAGERRETEARLGEVVVLSQADGAKIRVRDVAEIQLEDGRNRNLAFFKNGAPALVLRVDRSAQGDAILIQRAVERIVSGFNATLPAGVEAQLTRTRAQSITDRLNILWSNAVTGLGIVLICLFLFLSARTAFWVAAGLPTAILAAVALMWGLGISINMVSLFALILCLGIVVDDAIVVGEHADRLARDGLPPGEAAAQAAERMALPVFTASITTILAFSALILVGGRFGALIVDIPVTVCLVLIASLVECFIILPAHMRHALAARARERLTGRPAWWDWPSRRFNTGFEAFREHVFRPVARWSVRRRYIVVAAALGLLLHTASLFSDGTVRWRFWNAPERGAVTANFLMAPSARREDTVAMVAEMRRALDATAQRFGAEHGVNPVISSLGQVGGHLGRQLSGAETKPFDLIGGFEVELIDPDLRPYGQRDFARAWRKEIREGPLVETLVVRGEGGGPGGDAIDIRLAGARDAASLKAAAEALKAELSRVPGVSGLEDTMPFDRPELVLTLTPKGEALGFTTAAVGAEIRARLAGRRAATFVRDAREVDVTVAAPDAALDAGYLHRLRIPAPNGGLVTLTEVVEIREIQGFAAVRRVDGEPVASVRGDVTSDPELQTAARLAIAARILPEIEARYAVRATLEGLAEQEREFLSDALIGTIACLIGIYLTLAWVFASWTRPMAVMLVIPFGLIGAIWGHHLHGLPLSMFSIIGLIGMAGIIVNDSIVLVSTIDEKAPRRSIAAAVVEGTVDRLRAVMLTTVTTVGGLAPLLFETSRQALFLKPTVISLAYGLGFGMFLVLLLVPAAVMIQHDVGARLRSARRMASHLRRPRPPLGAPRRRRAAAGAVASPGE